MDRTKDCLLLLVSAALKVMMYWQNTNKISYYKGKSKQPRALTNIKDLPCSYYSASKAWMTSFVLSNIIDDLNSGMTKQGRNIVLLMDQAGCHTPLGDREWSNVKVIFLPPNCTTHLQPLDAGIIRSAKVHYRNLFIKVHISTHEISYLKFF